MTRRMPLSGIVRSSGPAGIGGIPAGAALRAPGCALCTSFATMRPPGPVPLTAESCTPRCAAIFFASGEAFTRPPEAAGADAAWALARTAGASEIVSALAAADFGESGITAPSAGGASPFCKSSPIFDPTATRPPGATSCWCRMPSSNASISIVALSVSTSASTSPVSTLSPTFLRHLRSVPSVMVSLSFGISM